MIPLTFSYHQPHSIQEAIRIFQEHEQKGKISLFFNGGTEIITMARIQSIYMDTDAVIDIKKIPECNALEVDMDNLVIGASISLAQLEEEEIFPLLGKVCSRIADHTSREKITLGGNICGQIKYKEAVLPLLLTDSELVIAGASGERKVSIHDVFDQQMNLNPGEFVVQIHIPKKYLEMDFTSKKQTKIDRIGYPLLTVSALKTPETIRVALSGLCDFPFRSKAVEEALNQRKLSVNERINQAINNLPAPILDDVEGSAAYRTFVLRFTLAESIAELEGV